MGTMDRRRLAYTNENSRLMVASGIYTKRLVAAAIHHLDIVDFYALLRRRVTRSNVAILMYDRICKQRTAPE
jgi:hypothetical protein